MASGKTFVVIEALDSPAGAILARYQIVERIEPDPEEERLASVPPAPSVRPPGIPQDIWDDMQMQIQVAESIYNKKAPPQIKYRTDEKMVVCSKPEEVTEVIREAREAYDEIRKLTKAGAQFDFNPASLTSFR